MTAANLREECLTPCKGEGDVRGQRAPCSQQGTREAGRAQGTIDVDAKRANSLGPAEFTGLIAMSMAISALGIDILLPTFRVIRQDFGLPTDSTVPAGLITTYLVGLGIGQLVYGPLADRFGRRPALFLGFTLYIFGAIAASLSWSIETLLVSRIAWGIGAGGPRTVALAIVRDRFDGDAMSRAMAFIFAVFILSPMVAPLLGASIMVVGSWRWVVGACVLAASMLAVWAWNRLPETLREEHRRGLRVRDVMAATRDVVTHRETAAYTLAKTLLSGAFVSYLATSEIIFGQTFDQAAWFPVIFGAVAAVMGAASLLSARLVRSHGAHRLAHVTLVVYLLLASALFIVASLTRGRPPLPVFLLLLSPVIAAHVILLPNLTSIALAPMGHVAGTASSIVGACQTVFGALLARLIDRSFDGTVLPFASGVLIYGVGALLLVVYAERGRFLRTPLPTPPAHADATVPTPPRILNANDAGSLASCTCTNG